MNYDEYLAHSRVNRRNRSNHVNLVLRHLVFRFPPIEKLSVECRNTTQRLSQRKNRNELIHPLRVEIERFTCGHCASAVRRSYIFVFII